MMATYNDGTGVVHLLLNRPEIKIKKKSRLN